MPVRRVPSERAPGLPDGAVGDFDLPVPEPPGAALRLRMREIAQARVRYIYRKVRVLLNREGRRVGKKLADRLFREEGPTLRSKPRRRRGVAVNRRERFKPKAPDQVWSLDFVADQLADGRRFRALTVADEYTHQSHPI